MIFFGLGGALGELGWRTPFLMYASSFVLLPLAAMLLWEPLGAVRTTGVRACRGGCSPPPIRSRSSPGRQSW